MWAIAMNQLWKVKRPLPAININNAEESKESCIKIYIFEIQITWHDFFRESWGVFYL